MKNHKSSQLNHNSLVIGWLYPELMNIYGDRGNIITLRKRAEWRGIKTEIKELNPGFSLKELAECNLLIMGGAQDRQQEIVNKDLRRIKPMLEKMIENGIPGLYVCGGFQFLGKYYKESNGTKIDGLGIFDLYTENPGSNHPRLIGNIAIKIQDLGFKIQEDEENHNSIVIGFENHGGRTYLGKNIKPFGKVIKGHGNNEDGTEGAIYKNSIGTYLHGPILPKNPELTDHLIKLAIKVDELVPLDDSLEANAKKSLLTKIGI